MVLERIRLRAEMLRQKREAGEDEEEFDSYPKSNFGDIDQYMERVKKQAEVAKKYIRQVNESQGYDVHPEVVPTSFNYFVSVVPLSPKHIQEYDLPIIKFCEAAIELYNSKKKNKTRYEFHKFAYATVGKAAGSIYYLTFHAATPKQDGHGGGDGGEKSSVVFEAAVYHRTFGGTPILRAKLCRIKAPPSVKNVRVVGDAVEGNIIEGVGHYVGGRQGPSKFEWFRLDSNTRERVLLLTGSTKYTFTREDVGHRLIFKYTPLNSVGQEGKSRSKWSQIVKRGTSNGCLLLSISWECSMNKYFRYLGFANRHWSHEHYPLYVTGNNPLSDVFIEIPQYS